MIKGNFSGQLVCERSHRGSDGEVVARVIWKVNGPAPDQVTQGELFSGWGSGCGDSGCGGSGCGSSGNCTGNRSHSTRLVAG